MLLRKWYLSGLMVVLFAIGNVSLCFAAPAQDDHLNYYISERGVNGEIEVWGVTIDELDIRRDDGERFPIITTPATLENLVDAAAGDVSGYFTQGIYFPPGTYTHVGIDFGMEIIFKGAVQVGAGQFMATGQVPDDPSYDTLAEALDKAVEITLYLADIGKGDIPENGAWDLVFEEGESYALKILWKVSGMEFVDEWGANIGVGLVWKPLVGFQLGAFQEEFTFFDKDGNELGD